MRPARRRRFALFTVIAAILWWGPWRGEDVAIGTFNIRFFPEPETDVAAVVAAIEALDADAFAVQEIVGVEEFYRTLRVASARSGRDYQATLTTYCRPDLLKPIYLGVVYDARRLALRTARALEPLLGCDPEQPHGMVAVLGGDGVADFGLASVHLKAGGTDADFERRQREWAWLVARLPALEEELAAPIVVAGDFNSTGYHEGRTGYREGAERRFIDETVRAAGWTLATERLGCSMYWQPNPKVSRWESNVLDHVLAPAGLAVDAAEARGMCARLGCVEQTTTPPEWRTVSDHCPVRAVLRR